LAKPNYQFEKRQRDLAKKNKQEEKRRQKLAGSNAASSAEAEVESNAASTELDSGTPEVGGTL
jgi:hypothetical protein